MKLLVISAAPLIPFDKGWKAYGPYVKEMDFWAKYADEIQFCCPVWESDRGLLVTDITFETQSPIVLKEFDIQSFATAFKSIFSVLVNLVLIAKGMKTADHIHLRCPGNVGLLGCLVQILFPSKPKTAKYAGNWDPKAKQPLSYRLQKWILSNTFLTRNMQVLVYGEWEEINRNIKPFFTASYRKEEITNYELRITNYKLQKENYELAITNYEKEITSDKLRITNCELGITNEEKQILNLKEDDPIRFLFVGTLSEGKRPLYAVQLAEALQRQGYAVHLDLYGEGVERERLETYIRQKDLQDFVVLKGNQTSDTIKKAYQASHFLLLPSKSEGWPKVVAEAMFWGCVPVATRVSCVPSMLANGERGVLLELDEAADVEALQKCIEQPEEYGLKAEKALHWSREYTLDSFEEEIKLLLGVDCSLE